ncbi:MAG TPA: polysaccharide biosynthesis protein [Cyanobacteria bacterium UBA8803]|nr:polysaccharide biosynthesis protein [Cyanobacteria bacterium UBA9273]HBL60867.1 polysaccharide biosynthesis protein [Cyanobacteria bacterium UBA8803]
MNLNSLKARIARLSEKPIVRHTLWMIMSRGLGLVLQAAYFVIIARALGAEQYGAFVGAMALVSIVGPFVSWGCGDILIKYVSRNRAVFSQYWGNALFVVFCSGLLLIVLILVIAHFVLPPKIPILLVFLVAISNLIFGKVSDTAVRAFMSVSRLDVLAKITVFSQASALITAIIFANLFKKYGVIAWACLYILNAVLVALVHFVTVSRLIGSPRLELSLIKNEIAEGFFFSISLSAQTIYNDIDKTMLARLSTLDATGIYAAAYRLIDVAFVPISSLSAATYSKFFQQGATGISGTLKLGKRLALSAGLYGIVAFIGLLVFAPIVPYVLGEEYANTVGALRWLALIPFFRGLQYFGADTLTGAGFQGLRSAMQIGIALFNILLNLWIIPRYSWQGAAWSSLASDGLLMVSLWSVVYLLYRQQPQHLQEEKE